MKEITKEKKIVIASLIVAVLMLTVAFAAMSSVLKINGTAKVDSALWDIRFINAEMKNKKGDAREVEAPVIDNGGINLTLKVALRKPKDEITYEAVIKNVGDIDAEIESIEYPTLSEDQAKIIEFIATYIDDSEITESQELKSKDEKTIKIVVRFKDISDESLLAKSAYDIPLTFKINYVQEGYNIAGGDMADDGTRAVLSRGWLGNSSIDKSKVEKVKFTRSKASSYNGFTWDASEAKDGSITGYYQDKDGNGLYEVVIDSRSNIYAPVDSSNLFNLFTSLKEIKFNNFNTSEVTAMHQMFEYCVSLESLDLSNFNGQNVTSMNGMFYNCSKLETLIMNNLNASLLTNVYVMFYGCSNLKEIDISNFGAESLTSMSELFRKLSKLEKVNLSNSGTINVTNMSSMFADCSELTSINLTNFKTDSVIDMSSMFYNCNKLVSLDVSNFDTSKVTSMSYMFKGCWGLTNLDVSSFITSNVTNMSYMFSGCSSLTSLDASNFDTSKVTTMVGMFEYCVSLASLDLSNFNTSNVTLMQIMFNKCSSLANLNLKNADFTNVTNTHYMFGSVPSSVNIIVGSQNAKDFLLSVRSNLSNIVIEA